jgi:hypothetical protein
LPARRRSGGWRTKGAEGVNALLETVHQLLEGREKWRSAAREGALLLKPKPAPVPALMAVDGAVAEQPTLGVRLYSACACGLTPSGKEVVLFDGENVGSAKEVKARMIALELALLSALLEEYPEALALADGSRISHLSALSGAGMRAGDWPKDLPPASWGKDVARTLRLALTSPRAVFVPKEEPGPVQTRGVMALLLEPGELYGPRPVKADLHLGSERYAPEVLRWYYMLPSRNVVKLETLRGHPPVEVLAAIGARSGYEGIPSLLVLADRLAKDKARAGLRLAREHLLRSLPPETLMPLLGPYRS